VFIIECDYAFFYIRWKGSNIPHIGSGILIAVSGEVKMRDLDQWIMPLLGLSSEAGDAICEHYYAPAAGDYESKGDNSPLTLADLASHTLLTAGLTSLDADIPVLSEESSPAEIVHRRQWDRYWLVDPLDGTKEFLGRTGEFTINIALIDNHRPVLGVLYLPLERVAYVGIPGELAQCYHAAGGGGWSASELTTSRLDAERPLVVLASRRHRGDRLQACLQWLDKNWSSVTRNNMGSALKFCHMARGQGDFYPRFAPCCEWDTAAGQAVLEAAGGRLLALDGEPVRYNVRDSLYSPPFYAISDGTHPLWQSLLQADRD
jgi:3'(2'), 5'-bisphosphate nucleotidase